MKSHQILRTGWLLCLVSTLGVSATAQRTWIVDQQNGPGAQFADLPPAVAAASAGDTILVRGGLYNAPVITKGVTITTESWQFVILLRGLLTVRDLPHGERCVLKRITLYINTPGVFLDNNRGGVHLEEVCGAGMFLAIRDCRNVTMSACGATLGNIHNSTVTMTGGGLVAPPAPWPYALEVLDSKLSLTDVWIQGSPAGIDLLQCVATLQPGPALKTTNSDILLAGTTLLAGGAASGGPFCSIRLQAPNIVASGGTVTYDPTQPSPSFSVQFIQGETTVIPRHVPALNGRVHWPGAAATLKLYGTPGKLAAIIASLPPTTGPVWGGRKSPWPGLWIDPFGFAVVHVGWLDSTGYLSLSMPITQLLPPGVLNVPATFQAVVVVGVEEQLSTSSTVLLN